MSEWIVTQEAHCVVEAADEVEAEKVARNAYPVGWAFSKYEAKEVLR